MERVLVVADHPIVFRVLRRAIHYTAGLKVVGEADGRQPIAGRVSALAPDVVLVEEMRDREMSLDRIREANGACDGKVIALLAQMDDAALDAVFSAGAAAVLSRSLTAAAFATVLRETARGAVVHRPARRHSASMQGCGLTRRETEILTLAAQGFTNGRIASELWITEQTVKFHLSNCYRKLGVQNRTQASRYAHLHSLVVEPAPLGLSMAVAQSS